ncbi:MAG: carbon-nitrogen hydrolase [Thermoplasmata archaeon]|nr:carbon-nitrogen hydrolase [Thermoplasmata archaeon]
MAAHAAKNLRIALVQMSCSPDPSANVEKAIGRIREAAKNRAQLVSLSELFFAQYFCQREDHAMFDLAEPIPGPTLERLAAVAREENVALVAPLFERRTSGIYHNTAAVLDRDGSLAGIYRKMHIPDDPLYYEKFYFTPGDLGFRTFRLDAAPIGVLICWDQWYPEAARITALLGAEVLFYPTAIGWHPGEKEEFGTAQHDAWQTIQRAHAIANGVYVAVANRVGSEHGDVRGDRVDGPGIEFWGGSFVADPFGRVIAQATHDREEILYADLDLALVEKTRQHWPFLRDRRIDAYGPISRRFLDGP